MVIHHYLSIIKKNDKIKMVFRFIKCLYGKRGVFMYIYQMYQFRTVVECNSISKAAEKLHISQPGLSKVITKIEEELQCKLFTRTKNSVQLNENGKIVFSYINEMLSAYEKMHAEIESRKNPAFPPPILISSSSNTFANYIINKFISENISQAISFHYANQPYLLPALEKGNADIVFSNEPLKKRGLKITNIPLCRETYGVLASSSSPLYKKKKITLDDIGDELFIRYRAFISNDEQEQYSFSALLFDRHNIHLKYVAEATSSNIVENMLAKTDYSILSTNVSAVDYSYLNNRKFIRFEEPDASYYIYVCHLEEKSRKIEPFLSWIIQNYKKLFSML